MPEATRERNGRIITFYSYKGGTGRSMTLANVAWILASQGRTVLIVDWDVEAPGVHRYFHPFLADPDLTSTDGLIDLVWDYAAAAVEHSGSEDRSWQERYTDVLRYVTSMRIDFPKKGGIDFLCAGRQNLTYSTRVSTFDWRGFYEKLGGGDLLEALRAQMRKEYDYILIDSRTGVSDTAGICTVHMPDAVVVCFTLNNQSIAGASGVAQSVQKQRGAEFPIFPVPTRVELAEKDKLERAISRARTRFATFPNTITDPARREEYWRAVQMLYWPYYAYEEVLATLADKPDAARSEAADDDGTRHTGNTLLASCERLTSYITGGDVQRMAPLPEARRLELVAAYSRLAPVATDDLIERAEAVFRGLDAERQKEAERLFLRLVRAAAPGHGVDAPVSMPVTEMQDRQTVLHAFLDAGVLRTEADPRSNVQVVSLAEDRLISNWPRMAQWIEANREFLLWVTHVQAGQAVWLERGRSSQALLSGAALAHTNRWLREHASTMTAGEREFLRASLRAKSVERMVRVGTVVFVGGLVGLGVLRGQLQQREEARREEARHYVQVARDLRAAGQLDSALYWLNEAVERAPSLADAWIERGTLRLAAGDTGDVVADFSNGVRLDSLNAHAWFGRARARLLHGDVPTAIDDYSRGLRLDSLDVDAYFDRGAAYQLAGQRARAIADFQMVLDLSTDARTIEAARVRLDSLGVRTATVPEVKPVVYVQISVEEDLKIADAIVQQVRGMGFDVAKIEFRPRGTARGDVRSFFESDRRAADDIASAFEKLLTSYGYRVSLQRMLLDSARFPAARRGRIEVWLPPLRPPAAQIDRQQAYRRGG